MTDTTPLLANLWARHPDDWYIEPHWCSQRLFARHKFDRGILDPAAGLCRIVDAARAEGYWAIGHDIKQRTPDREIILLDWLSDHTTVADNIVSNPPFMHCDGDAPPFVVKCLARARRQVALLLPSKWLHGDKRSRWLETTPLKTVYYLTPRPSMPPGPVIEAGIAPGGGRVDFAWFVWDHAHTGTWTGEWLRRGD